MSTYRWYHQAKARVEQFIPDLDAELEVEVEETSITPNDGGDAYDTLVLIFSHPSNPYLNWSMEVEPDEDFIDNQLEEVVRRIYFQRVE